MPLPIVRLVLICKAMDFANMAMEQNLLTHKYIFWVTTPPPLGNKPDNEQRNWVSHNLVSAIILNGQFPLLI